VPDARGAKAGLELAERKVCQPVQSEILTAKELVARFRCAFFTQWARVSRSPFGRDRRAKSRRSAPSFRWAWNGCVRKACEGQTSGHKPFQCGVSCAGSRSGFWVVLWIL